MFGNCKFISTSFFSELARRSQPSLKAWIGEDGFTLLELLVVVGLIGLLTAIVIPNFFHVQPGYERKNFITQLNGLVRYAQQNAITTGAIQQVYVDIENHFIELRFQTYKKDYAGEPQYQVVQSMYVPTKIDIPETIDIKNFVIEGFDEISGSSMRKTKTSWFFVVPEGLTQEVTLNFLDTKDLMYNGKSRPIGLVLNPFTAQFKEYDTFQK